MRWAFVVVVFYKKPIQHGGFNLIVRHYLGMLEAVSDDGARGKAVRFGEKFYPRGKGWSDHVCSVERVEDLTDLDTSAEAPAPGP